MLELDRKFAAATLRGSGVRLEHAEILILLHLGMLDALASARIDFLKATRIASRTRSQVTLATDSPKNGRAALRS